MKEFKFEVAISVAAYKSFTACSEDRNGAIEVARTELMEAGMSKQTLDRLTLTARFVEFDSGNASHAGGYFEIRLSGRTGDEANVEDAEKKHSAWMNR